ncbi:hypothetical protein [Anaerosporobacter faecicola]|uniref:hypothetical protein n=1 Tax=Anaerosporobacter faecicola TaxID=2718714 RepID=UPI00143C4B6D|nr:hypothetical protein [Anaerosporobacter faecicola]
MGRKKLITDDLLISMIDEFFYRICEGNAAKLKIPAIGNYLREHNYPNLKDYVIRRSEAAMLHVNELKKSQENESIATVVIYKSIDAKEFINHNRNEKQLIQSLTELSLYYKKVTDAATLINDKYNKLRKDYDTLNEERKCTIEELTAMNKKFAEISKENIDLTRANIAMKKMIDTYIYPEIANELLKKSGFVKETQGILKPEAVEYNLIKADTELKSTSKVIQGLFDKFKE